MSNQMTFQVIVSHAAMAIAPLKDAVSNQDKFKALFYALGWQIDSQPVPLEYQDLATDVDQVLISLENLPAQPEILDILNLLDKIKKVYDGIEEIRQNGPAPTGPFTSSAFLNELPERLIEYLTINYLQNQTPKLYSILVATGIIVVKRYDEVISPDPNPRPSFTRQEFDFDNAKLFVEKPVDQLKTIFAWGLSTFDFNPLMTLLQGFFISKGIAADVVWDIGEAADSYGFTEDNIAPNSRPVLNVPLYSFFLNDQYYEVGFQLFKYVDNLTPGLLLQPLFPSGVSQALEITHDTKLVFTGTSNLASQFGVDINPVDGIAIKYPGALGTALPTAGFGAAIQYQPEEPFHIFGNPLATRIELSGAEFTFEVNYLNDSFEVELEALIKNLSIILSGGDGDSFIGKIIGNTEKRIDFEFAVTWSNTGGLRFRGAGGFELELKPHIALGPLTIENLKLALVTPPSTPAKAKMIAAAGLKLELGPFTAVVQEVGVELALTFADGNAGPFDIQAGFKPPTGLGLTMNGETVSGGGFLSFNKDEGRYVGALELSIKKKIAIKAIGILTTKLPGGQPGYSLLLLITAEFQPMQLGFGFTLNGVGGLIALHRRMNTEALRTGVRNGTIDNILFPTNPVANINSIISSLETVFPIQEGRYSFGPMAIIGWGTPTLITAELGLFFELPDANEIALIGVIRAILPKEDKPILKLQIAFAGIINFEKKFITFDAVIFDSSIAGMALSGDMIFRLRWGDQPTFVLSVGGFHPKFPVPPLNIPSMRRLTVNLLGGDSPRLTLSTYFAITSNTAQFGAAIDLYWSINDNIKVLGYLGYDALFYFSPFRFQASIDGNLSVERKGDTLFSVSLSGLLEGPTPWHVKGSVSFEVLGVEFDKSFDKTFGQQDYTTLPDVDVLPKLIAAIQDIKNWQATMSTSSPLLVTVREQNLTGNNVVVHPQGTLAVNQKVVPLNVTISRFGNSRPSGNTYFSLDISYPSQGTLPKTNLKEYFAPNEYFGLSESERLNRPSFELFNAGAQVASIDTSLTTGGYRARQYDYETIFMDSRRNPIRMNSATQFPTEMLSTFSSGNASNNSPLNIAARMRSADAPSQIESNERTFAIAQTSNLSQHGTAFAQSYTEALAMLEEELELNPALEGQLQIVNTFELN